MGSLTRAIRSIARRKTRALLVIVALSLALSVIISIPSTTIANQQASQKLVNELTEEITRLDTFINGLDVTHMECSLPYQEHHNGGPYQNSTVLTRPLLNITDYSKLAAIPEIDAVIPTLWYEYWDTKMEYLHYENLWMNDLYISGAPLNASFMDRYASFFAPSPLPSNITEGRSLQAGDSGVIVLDEVIANNLGVGVGETINLFGQNFTVVGIQGGESQIAYLSEDAQNH
jgi:hypothetical protein